MAYNEKLVLDVNEPAGRNVFFRPLHRALETEVSVTTMANARRRAPSDYLNMVGGTIPGDRLTVDFKNLKYSVIDKLMLKENKPIWDQIKAIMASREDFPQTVGPRHEDEQGTLANDGDTIATWLYHIHKMVDLKHFTLIEGKLPSYDEIHKMGRVQLSQGYGLPEKIVEKSCFIPKTVSEEKQLVGAK